MRLRCTPKKSCKKLESAGLQPRGVVATSLKTVPPVIEFAVKTSCPSPSQPEQVPPSFSSTPLSPKLPASASNSPSATASPQPIAVAPCESGAPAEKAVRHSKEEERAQDGASAGELSPQHAVNGKVAKKPTIKPLSAWMETVRNIVQEDSKQEQDTSSSTPAAASIDSARPALEGRFDYASVQCGAKVLSHNAEAAHADNILDSREDVYMINPCETAKWVVVELCEEIGMADSLAFPFGNCWLA